MLFASRVTFVVREDDICRIIDGVGPRGTKLFFNGRHECLLGVMFHFLFFTRPLLFCLLFSPWILVLSRLDVKEVTRLEDFGFGGRRIFFLFFLFLLLSFLLVLAADVVQDLLPFTGLGLSLRVRTWNMFV